MLPILITYRYWSPGLVWGAVPIQVVSPGSVWPGSRVSGVTAASLISTATLSTNGAQTRNVVVPSLCSVAPKGSAALASSVAKSKATKISRRFDQTLAVLFAESVGGDDRDTFRHINYSLARSSGRSALNSELDAPLVTKMRTAAVWIVVECTHNPEVGREGHIDGRTVDVPQS